MRTLIYTAFVSLDGVVDSPGGNQAKRIAALGGRSRTSSFSRRRMR